MKDPLKQYIALRDSLAKEKRDLEIRLAEINQALALEGLPAASATPAAGRRGRRGRPAGRPAKAGAKAPKAGRAAKPAGKRRTRKSNTISLYDAVAAATQNKPLTKQEILDAIDKMGYKFKSKNPMNSLSTVLYGKRKFKNVGGKFSPP